MKYIDSFTLNVEYYASLDSSFFNAWKRRKTMEQEVVWICKDDGLMSIFEKHEIRRIANLFTLRWVNKHINKKQTMWKPGYKIALQHINKTIWKKLIKRALKKKCFYRFICTSVVWHVIIRYFALSHSVISHV